jgi:hypothetical protein
MMATTVFPQMHSITIAIAVSVQTTVVPAGRYFPDVLNARFFVLVHPEWLTGGEGCLSMVLLVKGKPQTLRRMVVVLIARPAVRNARGMGLREGLGGQALDCVASRAWGTAVSNLGGP